MAVKSSVISHQPTLTFLTDLSRKYFTTLKRIMIKDELIVLYCCLEMVMEVVDLNLNT
jgi:hypothetical protein